MDPAAIPADAGPPLPRGVRLRRDEGRQQWQLLAPERVLQRIIDIADQAEVPSEAFEIFMTGRFATRLESGPHHC